MNTHHKWLSGRSRKERCFKQIICFEIKKISHACNINPENGDIYFFADKSDFGIQRNPQNRK